MLKAENTSFWSFKQSKKMKKARSYKKVKLRGITIGQVGQPETNIFFMPKVHNMCTHIDM